MSADCVDVEMSADCVDVEMSADCVDANDDGMSAVVVKREAETEIEMPGGSEAEAGTETNGVKAAETTTTTTMKTTGEAIVKIEDEADSEFCEILRETTKTTKMMTTTPATTPVWAPATPAWPTTSLARRMRCPLCPYKTYDYLFFKTHILLHRRLEYFQCGKCFYILTSPRLLREHEEFYH